jgi:hypothetical protein
LLSWSQCYKFILQAWTYSCIFQIALRVATITTIIEEKISASVEHISIQIESQLIMEFDSINSYLIVSSYLNLSALAILWNGQDQQKLWNGQDHLLHSNIRVVQILMKIWYFISYHDCFGISEISVHLVHRLQCFDHMCKA